MLLCEKLQGSETLSLPFSLMTGVGFQEISTRWVSSNAEQNYEHIKFLLFQLEGSSIARNVFFGLGGDYGILGKGEVEFFNMTGSQFLSTNGSLGDAYFLLGYLIALTPDRPTLTYLIPETGYKGSWLALSTAFTRFKELWYGPFLGGRLKIDTNQGFIMSLSYHYHWLSLHHIFQINPLLSNVKLKFHHAYGHEAELNVQTYLFQNIKIGAALHYFYYWKAHPATYSAQREDLSIVLQYIYDF